MDDVTINITEVAETVLIEPQQTVEQISINISEGVDASVEVSEIVEQVLITVNDFAETVLIEVSEGQPGGGTSTTPYKIWSMPSAVDGSGEIIAYCGFSTDLNALTSEAKWAVKRLYQDGTEAWAGKTTFDQILDDYLTLTYT